MLSEHTRVRLSEGQGLILPSGQPPGALITLVSGTGDAAGLVEIAGESVQSRRHAWETVSEDVFQLARDRGMGKIFLLDRDGFVSGGAEVDSVLRLSCQLSSARQVDIGETASHTDIPQILDLNNRAFAGHPENGNWSPTDLALRLRQGWFRWDGLLLAREAGSISGFCWTKIHPDGVGEIYVLAVHPERAGEGLGSSLVERGLSYLKSVTTADEAIVYTSAGNDVARRLYDSLGFDVDRETRRLRFDSL